MNNLDKETKFARDMEIAVANEKKYSRAQVKFAKKNLSSKNQIASKIKTDTPLGAGVITAVTRRYQEYIIKHKVKPSVLYLGMTQKEILEKDQKAIEILDDGEVVFTKVQSEVKFK